MMQKRQTTTATTAPTETQKQLASRTSRLGNVITGRMPVGIKYCFYGDEGVGKSTLGASAKDPIALDIEDSTCQLDVARYSFRDGPRGHVPLTLSDFMFAVDDLTKSPHSFKTVVVDSVDALQALIWKYLLARDSGKQGPLNKSGKELTSIESYGYGKGYELARGEWEKVFARLDRLRLTRGMDIVLIGHAVIRPFKNPEGEDYDRRSLQLHAYAAQELRKWVDVLGFCSFEDVTSKLQDDSRARGISTGRRMLRLQRDAAFDAKSRIALPFEIEMQLDDPWGPLRRAVEIAHQMPPAEIKELILDECTRIGDDETTKKVTAAIQRAGDNAPLLTRYLCELRDRPAIATEMSDEEMHAPSQPETEDY